MSRVATAVASVGEISGVGTALPFVFLYDRHKQVTNATAWTAAVPSSVQAATKERNPLSAQVAEGSTATEDRKSKGLAGALYVGAVAV